MSNYYVDSNYAIDLSTIVTYSYTETEFEKRIEVVLSNGQSVEVSNLYTHSKHLFNALMEWHDKLWKESADGNAHGT